MRTLLDLDQIAARLGVEADWLRQRMPRLYRLGFPRPLPLPGIKRWDPAALDLWLDRWLPADAEHRTRPAVPATPFTGSHPANDAGAVDEAEDWAAIIDRRAAALARGE